MKKIFLALVFVSLVLSSVKAQTDMPEITTFILVRHAEKATDGTDDPDLKTEGHERARRFAELMKNTSVDAVYSTRFKRTKNTVSPLATAKGKEVQFYETLKPDALDALIDKHAGGTVVIAGHSNTVPQIANLLMDDDAFKNFDDSEYGNILIVSVLDRGKGTKVVRINY